jgi:hypothetical protein
VSAFVQINLEAWEARRRGDLTAPEWELALYIAFETDFRTGRLVRTLAGIQADLGWNVARSTMTRRLASVRDAGFVAYEVTERQKDAYLIQPTSQLLRAGKLASVSVALGPPRGATENLKDATDDAAVHAASEASGEEALPVSNPEPMQQPMQQPPIREEKRPSTPTAPEFPTTTKREPQLGEDGYGAHLAEALSNGHATKLEVEQALAAHEFVRATTTTLGVTR